MIQFVEFLGRIFAAPLDSVWSSTGPAGLIALARAIEPADRGELLSQSDPDAAGRPRPRAPGILLQTA
jgi:hypothetical protein